MTFILKIPFIMQRTNLQQAVEKEDGFIAELSPKVDYVRFFVRS